MKVHPAYLPVSMTIGHFYGWYSIYKKIKYDRGDIGPGRAALFVTATTCLAPVSIPLTPVFVVFYGVYKGVDYLAKRK